MNITKQQENINYSDSRDNNNNSNNNNNNNNNNSNNSDINSNNKSYYNIFVIISNKREFRCLIQSWLTSLDSQRLHTRTCTQAVTTEGHSSFYFLSFLFSFYFDFDLWEFSRIML